MTRVGRFAPCLTALALLACSDRLTTSRAEALMREQVPPEPVMLGMQDWDGLIRQGLVRENARAPFERRYDVTPEGVQLGLEQVIERGPGSISISFRARACDQVVDEVTTVAPIDRAGQRAAEVAYLRRTTAPLAGNPLFPDAAKLAAACDTTKTSAGRVIAVRDSTGWRVNRPPVFGDPPMIETQYEYDPRGLLMGAVSTAKFGTPPLDPDGDSLTLAWREAGDSAAQAVTVRPTGFQVTMRHLILMGQPQSTHGYLIASDAWGVAETLTVRVRIH